MAEHPVCHAVQQAEQLPRTTNMLAWLRRGALHDQHDAAALPVVESLLASLVADLEQQAKQAEGCEMVPPSHLLAEVAVWLCRACLLEALEALDAAP